MIDHSGARIREKLRKGLGPDYSNLHSKILMLCVFLN